MRFRQKIFLITFTFVTISINLIGIITINNNYKNLVNDRIESNRSNIHNIENILEFYNADGINSNLFNKDNTYYEIKRDDNIIYTNLFASKSNIEELTIPSASNNEIKATVSKKMLCMTVKSDNYEIILLEDIQDIFESRQEQIYFFVRVSMIFSFITAFCLYIIIFIVTRRIDKLEKVVNQVQKGNYSVRIKKLGNDEIGSLSVSFNKMVTSVDRNIKEIQRVSENRKNFIHDITHEIRTPLTSIIGYSSLIKNGKIKDINTIIEYNNRIYEEGNYLNLLSQRLKDIVLLENKKIELEDINISKVINEAVDSTQNNFEDVVFVKNIENDIVIESDETLLHSLTTNILKNAAVACNEKNNKQVEIFLNRSENNEVILKIQDNGKGMSEEQLDKVVEPFYTLSKDRNRKLSGMGLGLPLCVKISEVLNATLKLESKLGEGTIVTISFKI